MQSILRILPFALVIMSGSITLAEYAPARLLYNDGSHDDVLMISYSAGTANYKISKQSLDVQRVRKPKLESVYLYEPPIFSDAMSLYRARNYTEITGVGEMSRSREPRRVVEECCSIWV